jgi:hypothetical protein
VLSPSLAYRIGFGLISVLAFFVSFFGFLIDGEPTPFVMTNAVPLVLLLASACAVLYNDSWVFDRKRGLVENRFGLLPLYRRRRFDLAAIRRVGVESFRKGRPGPAAAERGPELESRRGSFSHIDRLVAWDAEGDAHVLDTARGVHRAALERTGRRVAEFCAVPYTG